jgi:hypothetical protein
MLIRFPLLPEFLFQDFIHTSSPPPHPGLIEKLRHPQIHNHVRISNHIAVR